MDKRLTDITDPSIITAADNCSDLYFNLFNNMYDGLSVFEFCGNKVRALYLNERYFDNVGFTKEQYLPYLDNITVTLFEEDEQRIFELAENCVRNKSDFYCEARGYRYDGSVCWVCVRARPVDFIKSDNYVFLASINDISKRKELEHQLSINRERYKILEETSSAFLFEYNPFTDTMVFSPGKSRDDFVIENYSTYLRRGNQLHPYDVNYYYTILCKACRKTSKGFLDIRSHNTDKTDYILCRIYYSSVADEYGGIISVLGRIEVICEENGISAQLISCSSEHDSCSLANAETSIKQISDRIHSDNNIGYLLVADIDDLTEINRKYGEETGSSAVKMAAGLLKNIFGDAVIFRYLGDEFVVYIENITEAQLYDMAEKLNASAETVILSGKDGAAESIGLTFSIGAAWAHNGSEKISIKDYFITADNALYKAKKDGKKRMYMEKIIF